MKTTTATKPKPYAVLVFGDAPGPGILNTYDNVGAAERHRKEWLACYSRRPDRPTAATYRRIDASQEADLLLALQQLAAQITDRQARVHIEAAVQDVRDWRNGARG